MFKRWTALLAALALLVSLQSTVFAFSDIQGDEAEADIIALRDAGIVSGISTETFAPKGKVTFAQAVELVVKGFKLNIDNIRFIKEPKASDYFTKVPDDSWYAQSFIIAQLNGLSLAKDVDPMQTMTREQFAKLLYEAMTRNGDFPLIELYVMVEDEKDVSEGYMTTIQRLLIMKVAKLEKGYFYPKREVTRGEAVQMLHRAIQFVKEHKPVDPVPPVDPTVTMQTEKVNEDVGKVTVSWGSKPNPGYRISIDRIEFQTNGEAWVFYSTHLPEPDKMYPQVITEPKASTYVASSYKPVIMPAVTASPAKDH